MLRVMLSEDAYVTLSRTLTDAELQRGTRQPASWHYTIRTVFI